MANMSNSEPCIRISMACWVTDCGTQSSVYREAFSGRITIAIFESVVLASEAVLCWLSQLEYLLYDTVLLTWIEGRSFLH